MEQKVLVIVVVGVNCKSFCCLLFLMVKWQHSCILLAKESEMFGDKEITSCRKQKKRENTRKPKKRGKKTPQKIEPKPLSSQNK